MNWNGCMLVFLDQFLRACAVKVIFIFSHIYKAHNTEKLLYCGILFILVFFSVNGNNLHSFFSGITRMELLLDNATFQIYILHTSGHIQVIEAHCFWLVVFGKWTFHCRKVVDLNLTFSLLGLPCGSFGQILVVVWQTLLEMLCPSFIILRRSMVDRTLYFTREHTARWVQRYQVPMMILKYTRSPCQSLDSFKWYYAVLCLSETYRHWMTPNGSSATY